LVASSGTAEKHKNRLYFKETLRMGQSIFVKTLYPDALLPKNRVKIINSFGKSGEMSR
jgi:hypothetical protein